MAANHADQRTPTVRFFLPDFCEARAVLAVVIVVELVAIIFAIAGQTVQRSFWVNLAISSLFLLWIGLCCAALLCRARARLMSLSARVASAVALTMLVSTVGLLSEIVYQIGHYWTRGIDIENNVFPTDHSGFLLRNIAIGFIVSALTLRYLYVASEWRRSVEQAALSRLHALQARIRPHFLFNSMNTIAALTRSDPQKAEQAVEDLADLFRASLNEATLQIPLEKELEIARTHARVEKLRLGPRLEVLWDVDSVPPNAQVPGLIIQPLLENAVYHGIERLPKGGTVTVRGQLAGDKIVIAVGNPIASGTGYREHEGNRIALDNIRQRLELAWPGRTRVDIHQQDERFEVTLTFPFTNAQASTQVT
jgi:two-component system, LytTR family, sensor histidine kinase AlgZ